MENRVKGKSLERERSFLRREADPGLAQARNSCSSAQLFPLSQERGQRKLFWWAWGTEELLAALPGLRGESPKGQRGAGRGSHSTRHRGNAAHGTRCWEAASGGGRAGA